MNAFRSLVLVLVMSASVCADSSAAVDDFYKNKMIQNIRLASIWTIENGIHVYSNVGRSGIDRKLLEEWGVQMWVDPWVETDRYLAQFRIKARGINYDIHNLYRQRDGNEFYEFWLIKVAATEWSGESTRSVFLVVRTDDVFGKREILEKSDRFIERYYIGSTSISLPIDNLQLLYDMQPWLFPDAYKGSVLEDVRVMMDAEGQIMMKD